MPRIRSIKPEIFGSPQLMNVAPAVRLLFIGLILQADDEGRGIADPRKLRALIFPGDRFPPSMIAKWLEQLARQGLIRLYAAPGHGKLYCIPTWQRHQKIDRPRPSSYPAPEPSLSARRGLDESSTMPRRGSDLIGSDQIGSDPTRARAGESAPAPRKGTSRAGGPVDVADLVKRLPKLTDAEVARHAGVDVAAVQAARKVASS